MLLLGHTGINFALTKIFGRLSRKLNVSKIDYGVVVLGAILPDIIDKSAVELTSSLMKHSGHWIAHTWWFGIVMIMVGLMVFFVNRHMDLLILGFGGLLHIMSDNLILAMSKLETPYWGKYFSLYPKHLGWLDRIFVPVYSKVPYLKGIMIYFFTPAVLFFEILGFAIIVFYAMRSFDKKRYGHKSKKHKSFGRNDKWNY